MVAKFEQKSGNELGGPRSTKKKRPQEEVAQPQTV